MRKYLLASAALLGLSAVAGTASAATFATTDPSKNASAFGAPQTNPDPGKIIVRLGGLMAVDVGVIGADEDKSSLSNAKSQGYGLAGYFRLYFGVDGKLTNGLIYGANAEMRTLFAGGTPGGYSATGLTAAVGGGSANSTAELWYTRRAYAYLGGDSWGIVRIGQGDGPLSLFTGGGITTGEAYDTGQWNGDVCDFVSAGCVAWAFMDVGNEYDTAKVVYISPKFAGFNLGVSFAPSSAALTGNTNAASVGLTNRIVTSNATSDLSRPVNLFEIAGRWQGNFGPVAIDTMLGYIGSSVVKPSSIAVFPGGVSKFRNLSVIDGGASVTVAGFSVFGHANTGQSNGTATPEAVLISGRKKDQLAWVAGAQWSGGPWTAGASYYSFESLGSTGGTGNRHEVGIDVGGRYDVVPGLAFFLGYSWGSRHQGGVNFVDAAGPATAHNRINSSVLMGSMVVTW